MHPQLSKSRIGLIVLSLKYFNETVVLSLVENCERNCVYIKLRISINIFITLNSKYQPFHFENLDKHRQKVFEYSNWLKRGKTYLIHVCRLPQSVENHSAAICRHESGRHRPFTLIQCSKKVSLEWTSNSVKTDSFILKCTFTTPLNQFPHDSVTSLLLKIGSMFW